MSCTHNMLDAPFMSYWHTNVCTYVCTYVVYICIYIYIHIIETVYKSVVYTVDGGLYVAKMPCSQLIESYIAVSLYYYIIIHEPYVCTYVHAWISLLPILFVRTYVRTLFLLLISNIIKLLMHYGPTYVRTSFMYVRKYVGTCSNWLYFKAYRGTCTDLIPQFFSSWGFVYFILDRLWSTCTYVHTYLRTYMCCCIYFAFADKGNQYERLEDQTLLEWVSSTHDCTYKHTYVYRHIHGYTPFSM